MTINAVQVTILIIVIAFVVYYIYNKISGRPAEKSYEEPTETAETLINTKSVDLANCYQRKNLLTKTEYVFYGVLKKKCDAANLLICPKVRLEDFIHVTATERMKYRGYIKSRHVDFLICDSALHILAALELDDPSHSSAKAQQADNFKNQLYASIGLPLFLIPTGQDYSRKIDELIMNLPR